MKITNKIKIKYLLLIILMVFSSEQLLSQSSGKKIIAVVPLTNRADRYGKQHADNLTETILNTVVNTRRFKVVDRTNFDAIFTEENFQKGENFIDGEVVEQGKKMGAEYIIAGSLSNYAISKLYTTDSKGNKKFSGYKGDISFALKIIDVKTGEIIATETFKSNSGKSLLIYSKTFNNKSEAVNAAIQNSEEDIDEFIEKYFPALMKIYEISDAKGSKAKEVVITGGTAKGLIDGQILKVVEISKVDIDGQTVERKKEIGWLKISSVNDEHFSTCKVTDGHSLIKEKFDNNANIWVISGKEK